MVGSMFSLCVLLAAVGCGQGDVRTTQWESVRPEVVRWFEQNFYGRPPVGRPADQVLGTNEIACAGGRVRIRLVVRVPEGASKERPAPVFVLGSHLSLRYGHHFKDVPEDEILSRGYALVRYDFNDVVQDRYMNDDKRAGNGVFREYGANVKGDDWGKVAAWAWGFSRVVDWIETRPELDAKRIAVVGHSRGGKTALWAAATDRRIALAISNGSGTGGAHLNQSVTPGSEQVVAFKRAFSWNFFCENFLKLEGRETELEHDADDLLRLIAPRLVYVASGAEDAGAGPEGEFEAARRASELWEAYGLKGLSLTAYPKPGTVDHSGCIGYHVHPGGHRLDADDWRKFLDFADARGWRVRTAPDATVGIDFTKDAGPMKPLDGICNSPLPFVAWEEKMIRDLDEIRDLGTPFVRLHDTGGSYGGGCLVDIPNIFRDMAADEEDPANYDFAFTDAYLGKLVQAGAMPYYRLGVTIENFYKIRAYRTHAPKDMAKYARVCEHIVRHYTKGWANGFTWKVPYWEIWNEPENRMCWLGTRRQFYELYVAIAREIKAHHPDVKVGGYAACRWRRQHKLDPDSPRCEENWLGWFEGFCDYVKAEKAPFEFFSWHLYSSDPDDYAKHAVDVKALLEKHGFGGIEQHLTEWNMAEHRVASGQGPTGAVYVASCICNLQKSPVAVATFYQAYPASVGYSSVFTPFGKPTSVYWMLQKFAEMRRLGTSCAVRDNPARDVYAIAAKGAKGRAFLVANDSFGEPRTVRLDLAGADPASFAEYRLGDGRLKFERTGASAAAEIVLPPKTAAYFRTE